MKTQSTILAVGSLFAVGIAAPVLIAQGTPAAPAATTQEASAKTSPWMKNLDQAMAKAKDSKRLVFVEFTGSDWCPPCKRLDAEVYSKPEFIEAATKEFVLVKLDYPKKKPLPVEEATHNNDVAKRFKVESYPTALVLDPSSGKELVRHSGYMAGGPEAFLKFINDELAVARDPEAIAKRDAERLARATAVPAHLKLWRTDWDKALADAKAQGKYVLAFFPAPYHQEVQVAVDAMNRHILKDEFSKYVTDNYVPTLLGAATLEMEAAWDDATKALMRERMRGHRLQSIMCFAIVDPAKDRSYITVSALEQPQDFNLAKALDEALAKTKAIGRDIDEAMALPTGPEKARRLDALIGSRQQAKAWARSFPAEVAAIMESDKDGSLGLRPKYALRVATKELYAKLDDAVAKRDTDAAMKAISDFEKEHGITDGSDWEGQTLMYRGQFYSRIGDEAGEKRIREEAQRKLEALRAKDAAKKASGEKPEKETSAKPEDK